MFKNLKINLIENKSYPKYIQLRDQLEEYIKSNNLESGEQLPDIVSMCKLAKLSNRSVERAYILLINDGVCFRRPKKGTFVRGNEPLATSTRPKICAVFAPADPMRVEKDEVSGRIYAGIQKAAKKANIDLLIISDKSLPTYACNNLFDLVGVIMLDNYEYDEASKIISQYPQVKFFLLNYHFKGFEDLPSNAYGIFNDDFAGGFEGTDYLLTNNCKNIKAVSVKINGDIYERRLDGFKSALSLNRQKFNQNSIYSWTRNIPTGNEQFAIGRDLAKKIIEEAPETDGIFCVNDLLASGVATELEKHNLRDKIMIIGYDNILPYLSSQGNFATVSINMELIGERAINILNSEDINKFPKIMNVAPHLMPRIYKKEVK